MKIEDMNEGVRILLERMKTNPDEFETPFGKWHQVVDQVMGRKHGDKNVMPFLYPEEINALFEGLRSMERNKFTADILRGLAQVDEEGEQLELPYATTFTGTTIQKAKQKAEILEALKRHEACEAHKNKGLL